MIANDWLQTNHGLWWWRHSDAAGLTRALGLPPDTQQLKGHLTVVPTGAPLLGRMTSYDNCLAYALMHGRRPTTAAIRTCLRTVDVPDRLMSLDSERLSATYRTFTWLAMARLAQTPVVIMLDPLAQAPPADHAHLRELLHEAEQFHAHMFVVTQDEGSAMALGARPTPPIQTGVA